MVNRFFLRASTERTNTADILFLDFFPPELWENKFLLFLTTKFMAIFLTALEN